MTYDQALTTLEFVLLVLIWLDGRKMLTHEKAGAEYAKKTFELYVKYFEKKEIERAARNEARRRLRAEKKEGSRELVSTAIPETSTASEESSGANRS